MTAPSSDIRSSYPQQIQTLVSSRGSDGVLPALSTVSYPLGSRNQGTLNMTPTHPLNVTPREEKIVDCTMGKQVSDSRMSEPGTGGNVKSKISPEASTDAGVPLYQQNQITSLRQTTNVSLGFASASAGYSNRRMKVIDIKPTNHLIGVMEEGEDNKHQFVDQLINENRLLKLNSDSSRKIIEMYEEILDPKANRNIAGGVKQWRDRIFDILAEHRTFAKITSSQGKEIQARIKKLTAENTELSNNLRLETEKNEQLTMEFSKSRRLISDLEQRLVFQNSEVLRLSEIVGKQTLNAVKQEKDLSLLKNLVKQFQVGIMKSLKQLEMTVEKWFGTQYERIMTLHKLTKRIGKRLSKIRETEHRLKLDVSQLETRNKDLQEKLNQANGTADRLTQECSRLTEQLSVMQREKEDHGRALAQERQRGKELEGKHQRLVENLQNAEGHQKKLKSEVNDLKVALAQKKEQNNTLQNSLEEITPKYKKIKGELDHVKEQVLTLTREKEESKASMKQEWEKKITSMEKLWEEKNSNIERRWKEKESKDIKDLADLQARLAEAETKREEDHKNLDKLKKTLSEQESKQFEELKTIRKKQLAEMEALREKNYKLILERNYCFTEKCQSEHGLAIKPQRPIPTQLSTSPSIRLKSEDFGIQNDPFSYVNPLRKYPASAPNSRLYDYQRQLPQTSFRESTPNRMRLIETLSQTIQNEDTLKNLLNDVS